MGDELGPDSRNQPPGKRRRHDVARQACERCRVKKTRCDEQFPCGLCRNLGAECVYSYRKQTRSEVSSNALLQMLGRLESKIDGISAKTSAGQSPYGTNLPGTPWTADNPAPPTYISPPSQEMVESAPCYPQSAVVPWSAHQVILWKPVLSVLPNAVKLILNEHGADYSTSFEMKRPRLPLGTRATTRGDAASLGNLSVSLVRGLCDSYFATFHLAYPVVDRTFFLRHTLPTAIHGEFGYDVESCVVLVVMALGCWSKLGLAEVTEYSAPSQRRLSRGSISQESLDGSIPGLNFFNESRKRIGWLINDHCLQSCQYYLLSGIFYAQLTRPVDWWTMTNRASTCCRVFWENLSAPCDEWVVDMQSRLFWNTVMFDAILAQELKLPEGQLNELSQRVPLPKFVKMKQPLGIPIDSETVEEDSFFHYHFLAQVAHRILLTRTKSSIFFTSEYSSPTVEEELFQQLERWRNQLPAALQFDDNNLAPLPDSPSNILVVSWLRFRYIIAKFHFGRPLLHKVLSRPGDTTDAELRRCAEVFDQVFQWEPIIKVIAVMKSCMPLKFQISSQLFGHLVLVYCFRQSVDPRLQRVVPSRYRSWCAFALGFLQETALSSPTLAKDAEIATILCQDLIF
ncbi:Zn(II)2Cys6 transcription factor [Aspergillus undulatus]|uniref:Zn(II)2Cys6 transcription factor n=1 Tax=Aspergillus undulatus TaxID=1810928 RepID=UPI003CCDBE28